MTRFELSTLIENSWAYGGLPGCPAAWLPGYLADLADLAAWLTWLPGCLAAWLPGCLDALLPGCLAAWLPSP